MSNQYLYKYIKEEIDNMSFLQDNVKLKRVGKIYKGLCPFHNEKTPSLTIYPPGYLYKGERQEFASFYCFGCGQGGDIIKFNQLLHNIDNYYDSALDLARQFDITINNDDDIKISYLQKKQLDEINLLSMDEINLICSKMLQQYISNHNTQKFLKYLDEQLDERNTYQAQSLIEETKKFIDSL